MAKMKKGIRQRGTTFMVDCTVDGVRNTKGGFRSYAEAEAYHTNLFNAKKNGADVNAVERSVAKGTKTLVEAFDLAYELKWKETSGEETALINANTALNFFGKNSKLSEINTTKEISRYKSEIMKKGIAETTMDRKLSALSLMLSVAVDEGWIAQKVKFKDHYSKLSKTETTRNAFLTDDQEAEFLERVALHAHNQKNGKWAMFGDFVIYCIDTGLRTYREALATQNRSSNDAVCIQWHNNTILVPAPKSKNGKARAVPMTQRVKKILEKWSAISGSKNKTKVFYGLSKDSVRHYWDTIRAEMGWQDDKNYCPYICRHTCASRLVMSGVGLPKVMAWMGHTRWETTMGYAHLAPSALNELASVLDNRSKIIDAKPDTLKLIRGSN